MCGIVVALGHVQKKQR